MSYQPYAPTPYHPQSSTPSLDTELKLFTTPSSRELYTSLAEIHAILISLEHLEKAFIKDTIPLSAYSPVCTRLLSQYHALLADDAVRAEFTSLDAFRERWGIECAAAARRISAGAVGEEKELSGDDTRLHPKSVAKATGDFITLMDALRLNYRANDELHPLVAAVISSVDKALEGTGRGWQERGKLVGWLIKLNQGRAGSEISEEEERELLWDVNRAYGEWMEVLE
ncbi:vacuolar protein sorting-associated protein Vps28 [Ascodesmis nigricans]|uniref:Vacuolar protein sorting-associated protein 28 n=1 Tax=Ascodesmis nigricans TaxID=341454 RepID=A0A4S2MT57_9PEZI|nr:vacuolar protein sorting-associated protein Vps28 [Ascodesmis nigricans]